MSSHRSQTSRMLLVLAWATVVGITPISASDEDQVPSASTSERFEGYLFKDVEGRPLPFQSDQEIEDFLQNAKIESVTKIPVGVSRPKKIMLSGEHIRLNAVFKFIEEEKDMVRDPTTTGRGKLYLKWRDSYVYDIAAYRFDRLMGFDRMPPVVRRKIKGREGSIQIWLEGTITENARREQAIKPPEIARFNQQSSTMTIFDNLVANRDSNLGNTLIDGKWRLWFIDCSRCFGSSPDLLYPDAVTHCDRQIWEALRKLDRSAAEGALSPYLSRLEIDVLFERRDKLIELLQGRIDEWGEELVLFDQRPPTELAPWIED